MRVLFQQRFCCLEILREKEVQGSVLDLDLLAQLAFFEVTKDLHLALCPSWLDSFNFSLGPTIMQSLDCILKNNHRGREKNEIVFMEDLMNY